MASVRGEGGRDSLGLGQGLGQEMLIAGQVNEQKVGMKPCIRSGSGGPRGPPGFASPGPHLSQAELKAVGTLLVQGICLGQRVMSFQCIRPQPRPRPSPRGSDFRRNGTQRHCGLPSGVRAPVTRDHGVPVMRCGSQSLHCSCQVGSATAMASHCPSVTGLSPPCGAQNRLVSPAVPAALSWALPGPSCPCSPRERPVRWWLHPSPCQRPLCRWPSCRVLPPVTAPQKDRRLLLERIVSFPCPQAFEHLLCPRNPLAWAAGTSRGRVAPQGLSSAFLLGNLIKSPRHLFHRYCHLTTVRLAFPCKGDTATVL